MRRIILLSITALLGYVMMADMAVTKVTAQQRYPWNGLVDIVVTIKGTTNEIAKARCTFVATNSATHAAIHIAPRSISQIGTTSSTGDVYTQRYQWNVTNDIGTVKIDDLALTVDVDPFGGVQLWEGGPYWAECNVGASKPEEYGYYFWWGDTVGYKRVGNSWDAVDGSTTGFSFDSGNCRPTYDKDTSSLLSLGYIDSTGNLVAAHDAATVHLGVPWRMPTDSEMSALIDNCTTTWITTNGVSGRLVTGKGDYATKSIFLPAAGDGFGSNLFDTGSYGSYWSSTPYSDYSSYAWYLYVNSGHISRSYYGRDVGRSVRPLREFAQ